MTIHLSSDNEQLILSLLSEGRFASSDELIEEALRLVRQRCQDAESVPDSSRRLENLNQLCDKLDALPVASFADGLTNRDHDRILYSK